MSQQTTTVTIVSLHGLESGVFGKKSAYLRKHFENVIIPDLETGSLNWNSNSFLRSGMRNISSLLSGNYYRILGVDILDRGSAIAEACYNEHNPKLIVASSMGGAIALETRRQGTFSSTPLLLLAPALRRIFCSSASYADEADRIMLDWYNDFNLKTSLAKGGPITVVHGGMDDVVPLGDSEELCRHIGARLIVAPNDDHSLNDYLLDGASRNDGSPQGDNLREIILHLLEGENFVK